MNRKEFLKLLGKVAIVSPALVASTQALEPRKQSTIEINNSKKFKLTTVHIAGLQYYKAVDYDFKKGMQLSLVREPKNRYDKYEVALYLDKMQVGYIPKENSRIIASLLDNGISLEAKVRYFNPKEHSWDRVWVSLWQIA